MIARRDGNVLEIDAATGEQVGEPIDVQVGLLRSVASAPDFGRVLAGGSDGIAVLSFNGDRLLARAFATRPGVGFASGVREGAGWLTTIDAAAQLGDSAPAMVESYCPDDRTQVCQPRTSRESRPSDSWWASRERRSVWDRVGNRVVFYPSRAGEATTTFEKVGWASGPSVSPLGGPWITLMSTPTFPRPDKPAQVFRVQRTDNNAELARIVSPGVETGWDGFASPGGRDFIIVNRNSGDSMTIDTTTWKLVTTPPFPAGSAISGSFDRSGRASPDNCERRYTYDLVVAGTNRHPPVSGRQQPVQPVGGRWFRVLRKPSVHGHGVRRTRTAVGPRCWPTGWGAVSRNWRIRCGCTGPGAVHSPHGSTRVAVGSRCFNVVRSNMQSRRTQHDLVGMGTQWTEGLAVPSDVPTVARRKAPRR